MHEPGPVVRHFTIDDHDKLAPAPADDELERDALAELRVEHDGHVVRGEAEFGGRRSLLAHELEGLLHRRSHPVQRLRNADIFVLPSVTALSGDMEGIPVALMEAMAQGLPVLATRHSGTPELVEHEVSGLLCAEGDREALARNMLAFAKAPERWTAMGAAGAAKVGRRHQRCSVPTSWPSRSDTVSVQVPASTCPSNADSGCAGR